MEIRRLVGTVLLAAALVLAAPVPILAGEGDTPPAAPAKGDGGGKGPTAGDGKIRFVEVAPGCLAAVGPDGDSTAGAVLGTDSVAVIDCMGRAERTSALLAEIRRRTDRPVKFLVYTHAHLDHTVGSRELPEGVEVLGTEEARKKVDRFRAETEALFEKEPKVHAGVGMDRVRLVTRVVKGQLDLDLGGVTLRLYEVGHAHSEGDLIALIPEAKVLYAGDLVSSGHHPNLTTARTFQWITALAHMDRLGAEFVVAGHGEPGGKELLETQREYLMNLRRIVKHLVQKKTPVEDILTKLGIPEDLKGLGHAAYWRDNLAWVIREIAEER